MSRCFLKTKNKNSLLDRGKTIISSVNKIGDAILSPFGKPYKNTAVT